MNASSHNTSLIHMLVGVAVDYEELYTQMQEIVDSPVGPGNGFEHIIDTDNETFGDDDDEEEEEGEGAVCV
jgi:hypothetical protein